MSVIIDGSAGVTTNSGAVYNGIQSGTAVASTSGTAIDFTGIPSWVKRVTVMFSGVSTSGTSAVLIQLGTSGGIENTGYLGTCAELSGILATSLYTTGIGISGAGTANTRQGVVTISLFNASTNTWAGMGNVCLSNAAFISVTSGAKSLSDVLDRIRITTVNGTDTFDAGSVNIMYE